VALKKRDPCNAKWPLEHLCSKVPTSPRQLPVVRVEGSHLKANQVDIATAAGQWSTEETDPPPL